MSEEKKQITDTIDRLEDVLDLFYQQNNKEAFEKLTVALDDIANAVDCLEKYKSTHLDCNIDEKKICDILTEAMQALQAGDKVLMADILQYDFVEYINELVNTME